MTKSFFYFILVFFSFFISFSQTSYSTQTSESLQKLKADAVKASDFTKAAEVKKELDIRDAEQKQINALQAELDKKVKAEDFTGAAEDKKQLQVLKDNKAKKDELRKQIASAVVASDFDKAAKYKSELGELTALNHIEKSNSTGLSPKTVQPSNPSQNAFEGKVIYWISYDNVPEGGKASFEELQCTYYFKKNKVRFEFTFSTPKYKAKIAHIIDYDKEEYTTIVNLKALSKDMTDVNSLNIKKIAQDSESKINSIKYHEEFKSIQGMQCQKVTYKIFSIMLKQELEMTCFVNKDYVTADLNGQPGRRINPFLMLDHSHPVTVVNVGTAISKAKTISVSKESISDDLFKAPTPEGYVVTDERSNQPVIDKPTTSPETNLSVSTTTLCNADGKFELTESGDLMVKGNKIASIKKTKKGNILWSWMPEFTVYDIQGKAWMYFEGIEGKMRFLDDNKSFLPRKCDASSKSVAEFIASDCIFTETGFNLAYRGAYIKKNGGYDALRKYEAGERDRFAGIDCSGSTIMQSGQLIGSYRIAREAGSDVTKYEVYNPSKKPVAIIVVTAAILANNNMAKSEIILEGSDNVIKKIEELGGRTDQLFSAAVSWLVRNNNL